MKYRIITKDSLYRIQGKYFLFWKDLYEDRFDRDGYYRTLLQFSNKEEALDWVACNKLNKWTVLKE